ncbi:putative disease resistance RPP13-like protein 1 [Humulus lupulus]|uniref:putative disease resistance RPP13-like protein 1 n=1 Tax=Humulus lupulus TaxID=3486 RepID=UPI002B411E7D|nr:putative disease resistance RPP13-like protein 1 [Humulus lupulus]
MADLVGGALLSALFNVLFDRLDSQEVTDFFQGKEAILQNLKTLLLSANVLLNDAEEKQLGDKNVKKWLEDLKEVIYEADHVMDKINTEALRLKMEKDESESTASKSLNFFKRIYNSFEIAVKSEIEGITSTLKNLLDQTEHLGLKKVELKTTLHRPPAPLLDDSKVYGRDNDKYALVKRVLCDDVGDHRIVVIPIIGMGGIGKTTLTQSVYDNTTVQQHFDLKVWVTISEDFDVLKITKLIFEAITETSCEAKELYQLQNKLKNALIGKKFLFVLDDVWNENYLLWDSLKSSFQSGDQGSKIIVTTRSKDIALMMRTMHVQPYELKKISFKNCWKLFAEHVIDNIRSNEEHQDMKEIGKQIVKKCKGLPLAVKSMAGLLRSMSTSEEWRHVLQSDIWELSNCRDIGIVPALWLSYRFLPPHLKPCFSFLSIFPKDYEFWKGDRERIILIWMAEGLLQPQKGKRIEDVGEEYMSALISRSFFQRSRHYSLSMHDLMHDLAMYVSGQCCSIYDSCNDFHKLIGSKTRHLSYMKDLKDTVEFDNFSRVKYLRTLLALPLRNRFPWQETQLKLEIVLKDGGYLRSLSLSESCITDLHDSIGNLKHLRYLDVSRTKVKELPHSVCGLYNLETLLLSGCGNLTQLPTNISKLVNLRHLMTRWTPLKEMPPKICDMINLQRLSNFVVCKNDGSRIKELGKLDNLHERLEISGLEHVREVSDVLEGNLKNKKYLNELILDWNGEADDSTKEREVLDALQPHVNLKKLVIRRYNGTSLPDWVTHPSYCNLKKVKLQCTNLCLSLLSFRRLSSLIDFRVFGVSCLDKHDEFRSISLNKPFPFLAILWLDHIDMLDWSFINTSDERCEIFQCLKQFDLVSCGKLSVALPMCNFPSLEYINISSCDELVTIFPTSTHIDSPYPSLNLLNTMHCSRLETFSEMGLPFTLQRLRIASCDKLMENRMKWNLQGLPSLISLELWHCGEVVDSFPEEWLLPPSLRSLKIFECNNLKALNSKGFQHLTSLRQLDLLYLEKCNDPLI